MAIPLLPATMVGISGLVNNAVNGFNTVSDRTIEKELEEKRRETQLKIEYTQIASHWKLAESRPDFQLKMEAERQQFQTQIVEYQCQENRQLQEFIKTVDAALTKSNQQFQTWLFHQNKQLQKELAEYNRQTQLEMAILQRESFRQNEEYRQIIENSPMSLTPEEIIHSHGDAERVPLRVIIAPPEIDYDSFSTANQSFPKTEKRLSQALKNFVEKYYPIESNLRPTEFISGTWESKKFRGTSAVKRLFGMLKSEPVLILESEVDGDFLNLNLAYWSGGQSIYSSKTVLSNFPYREVLDWSAKTRAFEWETNVKNKLLDLGKSEEEINQKYGVDNALNLALLKEQQILEEAGIPFEQHFKTNRQDWDKLCQFLTAYHNLLTAFFADVHYLIYYNLEPQLPQLLLEIIGEFSEYDAGVSMVQWAVAGFLDVFKALETDRPALIPDLSIDLAINLAAFPDKSFGQKVLEYSVFSWLKARSLPLGSFEENLATLEPVLVPEDVAYAGKLNCCFAGLENHRIFSVIQSCNQRGMTCIKEEKYAEGIVAFTQALSLNKKLINAYFNRGLAYSKTKKYREAITDYSQVIELQPTHAQAVNNRGTCYYELGEYEQAVNDFDRAVNLGLETAAKNREVAQGVLQQLNGTQQEEEEKKQHPQGEEAEEKLREEWEKCQEFTFETVTVNSSGEITNRRQGSARQKVEKLPNNVTLEMVYIPGGTFTMGSPESEENRDSDEGPQHQVKVPPFYLGKYPVTQAQYHAIMGNNPSNFKGEKHPVQNVTWHDAIEFCEKLSQETGKTYRLPSEAEWEYACRGGTMTPFCFGETLTSELANYDGNSTYASGPKGVYQDKTVDVGSFPPNAFGVYDMHGNVWEWCQDLWHDNYNGAPTDGSAWESNAHGHRRLQRGGSWFNNPGYCRSANRCGNGASNWCSSRGFRVVQMLDL